MSSNSKEIAKLKKKYSKWSGDGGFSGLKKKILMLLPAWCVIILLNRVLNLSEYRLKRESIKFFQMSNRAYGAKKLRRCDRLLCISLELLGSNLPNSYKVLLRNSVVLTLDNQFERRALSNSVLIATKELEPSLLDATCWYQLSRGLFSIGYFRAAWCARENSLDISIDEGLERNSSPTAVVRAVEADLERLNLDSVRKLLELTDKIPRQSFDSLRAHLNLFERSSVKNPVDEPIVASSPDQLFHELVYNKNVALVGPGHPHGEYGIEIDSAETVTRVKFVGEENLPPSRFHGARCNIAYQAALNILNEYVEAGLNLDFYQNIDMLVSNSELPHFSGKPVVTIKHPISMYRTTAISGVIMLYQLINARPKAIKIYGFDFRAHRKQYSDSARDFYHVNGPILGNPYPGFDSDNLPSWIVAMDFSEHDFVSNFCFAQNLYKAGLFDIEPYGKSILELTPYQYVERLEEMLGDW